MERYVIQISSYKEIRGSSKFNSFYIQGVNVLMNGNKKVLLIFKFRKAKFEIWWLGQTGLFITDFHDIDILYLFLYWTFIVIIF